MGQGMKVPEREMSIKVSLEDLTDQINTLLLAASQHIHDWEDLDKIRKDISEFLEVKSAQVRDTYFFS